MIANTGVLDIQYKKSRNHPSENMFLKKEKKSKENNVDLNVPTICVVSGMLKFNVSDEMELLPEHLTYTSIHYTGGMDDEVSEGDEPITTLRPTHG